MIRRVLFFGATIKYIRLLLLSDTLLITDTYVCVCTFSIGNVAFSRDDNGNLRINYGFSCTSTNVCYN